jgi:hypothetical protein
MKLFRRARSGPEMTAEEITQFRRASVVRVVVDPVTKERVICHVHPDGRVLVDAVRLPKEEPR